MGFKDIAIAKQEAKKQEVEFLQNKLHEQLMSDQEFLLSTNKKLRDDYARRLWKKPDSAWIRGLFSHNGDPYIQAYYAFIERVYNEYKHHRKVGRLEIQD